MFQALTRRTQFSSDTLLVCRSCANIARKTVLLEEERPAAPTLEQLHEGRTNTKQQTKEQPAKETEKSYGLAEQPDPHEIDRDYIGPPDELSNLRPIVRSIHKNETPLAAHLRKRQQEIEQWNQDFWSKHNKRFYDEKKEFVDLHKAAGNEEISADKMSIFYKSFLDKNLKMHTLYNVSWYMKNMELLVLAFQVFIQKLYLKRKNRT